MKLYTWGNAAAHVTSALERAAEYYREKPLLFTPYTPHAIVDATGVTVARAGLSIVAGQLVYTNCLGDILARAVTRATQDGSVAVLDRMPSGSLDGWFLSGRRGQLRDGAPKLGEFFAANPDLKDYEYNALDALVDYGLEIVSTTTPDVLMWME